MIFGNSSNVSKFQELGRERKKSTGVYSKREREREREREKEKWREWQRERGRDKRRRK